MAASCSGMPDVEKLVTLKKDEELLVKIPAENMGRSFVFIMIDGKAEILGTCLGLNKQYEFEAGRNLSILAGTTGCTISITKGQRFVTKIVDCSIETTTKMLRDFHGQLENSRCIAETENKRGPVVCILGPSDSGKSMNCIALINYAVQSSRRPVYVDLDLGQGGISIAGTFTAVPVISPVEFSGDFSRFRKMLLSYFVGSNNPGENVRMHNLLVSKFAKVVLEKLDGNIYVKSSGMIINTCGWVEGAGYHMLTHIIEAFQANQVLVMGEEPPNLVVKLRKDISLTGQISCLPKSELVSERTKQFRKSARMRRVREYFTERQLPFQDPYTFDVHLSNIKIFKLPDFLPPGKTDLGLSWVPPSRNLINHLLGVSKAEDENQDNVLSLSGYVRVININMRNGTLTVLSPRAKPPFTEAILLLSNIVLAKS